MRVRAARACWVGGVQRAGGAHLQTVALHDAQQQAAHCASIAVDAAAQVVIVAVQHAQQHVLLGLGHLRRVRFVSVPLAPSETIGFRESMPPFAAIAPSQPRRERPPQPSRRESASRARACGGMDDYSTAELLQYTCLTMKRWSPLKYMKAPLAPPVKLPCTYFSIAACRRQRPSGLKSS